MYTAEFCKKEMIEAFITMAVMDLFTAILVVLTIVGFVMDSFYAFGFATFAVVGFIVAQSEWKNYLYYSCKLDEIIAENEN